MQTNTDTVLITRPAEDALKLQGILEAKGIPSMIAPMIKLSLVEDLRPIKEQLNQIEKYDWIIFTSPNSVAFFFEIIESEKVKLYFFPNLKFATVGEKTKMKLEEIGYRTNFVPIKFTAKVLAENIHEIEGKHILIPTSNLSNKDYIKILEERGAHPKVITIYHNLDNKIDESTLNKVKKSNLKYITFCSGSAIHSFVRQLRPVGDFLVGKKVITIGPSTSKVAKELKIKVDFEAKPHTEDGIIEAILNNKINEQT
ncbi:MAG: hypothetical protein CMO34_05185 [Verrucomicrobia bacterium]|nr:hypothetical protein [Verrucomicrobiota bacterium]